MAAAVRAREPWPWFAAWMVVWGATVAAQLSTLTARDAPPEMAGRVLTFANGIGFAITVLGIERFVRERVAPGRS